MVGGIPRRGNSVGKGDAVSLAIFSSWGVTNGTTVTFNYILVIDPLHNAIHRDKWSEKEIKNA